MSNMRCYVCDDTTNWESVKKAEGSTVPIHSEMNLQVCRTCGNVCHEVDVSTEKSLLEFYRKGYRPPPNIMNLTTTTHKQNYVALFLREFLAGKKGLVTGDVGCATGYLPAYFRRMGHKSTGCEYTLTYRRFAEHYYGIPITEELEPKHKYDLITLYHVLEHMMNPDEKLKKYVDMLADGGHIMVSTPRWFEELEEASGTSLTTFDHWFHKNHINLFSRQSLQNLFAKCGLEIVKEDHLIYGQTYLLRKVVGDKNPAVVFEDWKLRIEQMRAYDAALIKWQAGDAKAALDIVPNFPEAWLRMIFVTAGKDVEKQGDLIEQAEAACPGNVRIMKAKATWLYQNTRLQEALKVYDHLAKIKPNEDDFMFMGFALAQLGDHKGAINCFLTACSMDPRKWPEAQNWACSEASKMPTWDEVGVQAMKDELYKKAQEQGAKPPKPADPVMGA